MAPLPPPPVPPPRTRIPPPQSLSSTGQEVLRGGVDPVTGRKLEVHEVQYRSDGLVFESEQSQMMYYKLKQNGLVIQQVGNKPVLAESSEVVWELRSSYGTGVKLTWSSTLEPHQREIRDLGEGQYIFFAQATDLEQTGFASHRQINVTFEATGSDLGVIQSRLSVNLTPAENSLKLEFTVPKGKAPAMVKMNFTSTSYVHALTVVAHLSQKLIANSEEKVESIKRKSQKLLQPGEYLVDFEKDAKGVGMALAWDKTRLAVIIKAIEPGGVVARTGKIRVGDAIKAIQGERVDGVQFQQAIGMLYSVPLVVVLIMAPPPSGWVLNSGAGSVASALGPPPPVPRRHDLPPTQSKTTRPPRPASFVAALPPPVPPVRAQPQPQPPPAVPSRTIRPAPPPPPPPVAPKPTWSTTSAAVVTTATQMTVVLPPSVPVEQPVTARQVPPVPIVTTVTRPPPPARLARVPPPPPPSAAAPSSSSTIARIARAPSSSRPVAPLAVSSNVETTSSQQTTTSEWGPQMEKYVRMRRSGVSESAVMNAITRDGIVPPTGFMEANVQLSPAQPQPSTAVPNPSTNNAVTSEYGPEMEKYVRMKRSGLPDGAVANAMNRDGIVPPPGFFGADFTMPQPAHIVISHGGGGGGGATNGHGDGIAGALAGFDRSTLKKPDQGSIVPAPASRGTGGGGLADAISGFDRSKMRHTVEKTDEEKTAISNKGQSAYSNIISNKIDELRKFIKDDSDEGEDNNEGNDDVWM